LLVKEGKYVLLVRVAMRDATGAEQGPHALPITGSVCVNTLKYTTSVSSVATKQPRVLQMARGGVHATSLLLRIPVPVKLVWMLRALPISIRSCVLREV